MRDLEILVDVKDVTRNYGSGHAIVHALSEVSLHLVPGEVVMIMGPSGAGKSTLLQIIGGMMSASSGDVFFEKKSLKSFSRKMVDDLRRKRIGFIYQTPNLLPALTAKENIEIVLHINRIRGKAAEEKALSLLDELGLKDRAGHKPSEMSGGEQQRVSIARALANDPKIILADEPTASLDSKNGYSAVEKLRDLSREKGVAVIIVTHDARIRNFADRIFWLEDGRLSLQKYPEDTYIDPVCFMVLDPDSIPETLETETGTVHFCSSHCKERYMANPGRFELH